MDDLVVRTGRQTNTGGCQSLDARTLEPTTTVHSLCFNGERRENLETASTPPWAGFVNITHQRHVALNVAEQNTTPPAVAGDNEQTLNPEDVETRAVLHNGFPFSVDLDSFQRTMFETP